MEADGPTDDIGTDLVAVEATAAAVAAFRPVSCKLGSTSRPGGSPGVPKRSRNVSSHSLTARPLALLESEGEHLNGCALQIDGNETDLT